MLVLQLENVGKTYAGKDALSAIDLSIESGEFIGLIGANGAGKSTLLKIISGLISNFTGNLVWKGKKITNDEQRLSLLKDTKALIETPQFYPNLSGIDNLIYFTQLDGAYSNEKVVNALQFVGLFEAKDKPFKQYSLGMKQKLGLARIFSTDCSFIILDEPFHGLDPKSKEEIKQILIKLYQKGKTLLVSSHLLEDLSELSNRVIYLENGKLKKNITWKNDREFIYEINVQVGDKGIQTIQTLKKQYQLTYRNDQLIIKIEREKLPIFLKQLMDENITFYEVVDITKTLQRYFEDRKDVV